MAKRKTNYKEILAKSRGNKDLADMRGHVAAASIENLRIAIMATTLEVLGISADMIMAINDKETAGAYLLRAAYIGAADEGVGGFDRGDMIEMFNASIDGESYDA